MGSVRVTLCAGLLSALAFAPTAYAADGGVSVSPASPAPGTDIALRVNGCAQQRTGTAVSAAFVADVRLTGAGGTLFGESRVRSTLTAGTYEVTVACGDTERSGAITVGRSSGRAGQPDAAEPPAPAGPSAHSSPVAPVQAGGGGAAHLSAVDAVHAVDTRGTGPGAGHTVTGLLLAGAAAVAVALRSVRRSRGTD
ncbi:hypothetical protein [Streptomyces sp. TRM68367]|uniref:hypothetical protein n=1 Tax=Streptomyces sp. TRM68367 TaxID=2758415 RepID=UPI00165C4631|nr:hypothetical protein [Streptomyces sp. TRM68367]MBC9730404.1 hypothetical protein [Streptomyces sp. TRM68367]